MTSSKFPTLLQDERIALVQMLGAPAFAHLETVEALDASWSRIALPGEPGRGRASLNEPVRAWSISRAQGMFLYSLVRLVQPRIVLELGASLGYSTTWLGAAVCTIPGAALTTVENDAYKMVVLNNLRQVFGLPLRIVEQDISEFLCGAHQSFDLVFVDADPFLYAEWAPLLLRQLSRGATVIIDNVISPANLASKCRALAHDLALTESWTIPLGHGILIGRVSGQMEKR